MTDFEVIEKIMNSYKISKEDKVWYIKQYLLHWFSVEDLEWLWNKDSVS